jgi:uncharacterized protein (TIGR02597 family)
MRMNLSSLFMATALALTAGWAEAQTIVNTVPEGVITTTLLATSGGPSTTTFSLPLISDPTYTGAVSALSTVGASGTDTISVADSPAPWTAGGLANFYFVKFLSGVETGRVMLVTANTTNSLTLDITDHTNQVTNLTTTGFAVAVGDSFEVFPADTLASLFGDSSSNLILTGGTLIIFSDDVSIFNPVLGRWQSYFFNTSAGVGYWETTSSTLNANNTIIYPYGAFRITRQAGEAALSLPVMGRVAEVPVLIKTAGSGASAITSTGYAAPVTLADLTLGSNWSTSTIAGAAGPVLADTLSIWDSSLGRFDIYYQYEPTGSNTYTWLKSGDTVDNQGTTAINPGTVISLHQNNAVSGVTSFIPSAMPYTLDNTY